jgi:hypothetical protein
VRTSNPTLNFLVCGSHFIDICFDGVSISHQYAQGKVNPWLTTAEERKEGKSFSEPCDFLLILWGLTNLTRTMVETLGSGRHIINYYLSFLQNTTASLYSISIQQSSTHSTICIMYCIQTPCMSFCYATFYCGSVAVKALCYKLECRGFDTWRWFFKLT